MATWNGLKRPSRVIVSVAGLVLTVAATAEDFGYALRSIESGRPATFASRGHGRPVRLVDAPRRKIAHCVSVCCLPALQPRNPSPVKTVYRRSVLFSFLFSSLTLSLFRSPPASADASKGLQFEKTASGLQWADAKVGSGTALKAGMTCTIDYVMSTSGARYGSKIYSTKDVEQPYRWTLGDGSTIKGLELAITGGEGMRPMLPGGIRRVIVPASLGYESLAKPIPGMQFQNCQEGQGRGPIPPELTGNGEGAYQRFKNIYCNANRPYQPDLVLDIKLYGKRDSQKVVEEEEEE